MCNQKIYVVETMFALQFVYISYIPIGFHCQPFLNLSVFKYSFGWNVIPLNVDWKSINWHYSYLGFESNFLSNINFMLIPIIFSILVSPLFYWCSRRSKGYRAKPRLLALSKNLLLEIPFTLILLNTPNILTSFIINF